MRVVLASRNDHKAREFAILLAPHQVVPLPGGVELPPEDRETFEEHALDKARAAARATGLPAIGDDSGVVADALRGRPGVHSARFAGPDATDQENLAKLLRLAPAGTGLAYVCALAWAEPGGTEHVVVGRCTGTVAAYPRGDNGFGYDPAFVPDDLDDGRTMAELAPEEKDAISHRGRAARELLAWLAPRTVEPPVSDAG
jgi:XTP/dITP diphosphohydrolase